MKRFSRIAGAVLVGLILCAPSFAQLTFSPDEYRSRRSALMDATAGGTVVVLGAQQVTAFYPFYQNNDFLYLTGVEIPNAILIIDSRGRESHLFYTLSKAAARNDGVPSDLYNDPVTVTGIGHVHPLREFKRVLDSLAESSDTLYTCFHPEELMRVCSLEKARTASYNRRTNPWDTRPTREAAFISFLKNRYPERPVRDCQAKIWNMRIIKSPAEIGLMRNAGRIAVKAHREMIRSTRVGMKEYELAALFRYYLEKEGCQELSYETIVCSGPNHPFLHYYKHDRTLKDGDFIVIDAGPDHHYYDIDITVSYPANGMFTERQKYIYHVANTMHEACMQVYRPGLSRKQAMKEVRAIMREKGIDLNDPMFDQRGMKYAFGHYVGMAVHDVGNMPEVLQPGMVIANEPFAVFADENLGVRVEDTILITADGCENLTAGIPRTVKEIEAFMKEKGAVQVLKENGKY